MNMSLVDDDDSRRSPCRPFFGCTICWEVYTTASGSAHQPLSLPCGHTICGSCVQAMRRNGSSAVVGGGVGRCPWCRSLINLRNLPVNIAVVQIMGCSPQTAGEEGDHTASPNTAAHADAADADAHHMRAGTPPLSADEDIDTVVSIACALVLAGGGSGAAYEEALEQVLGPHLGPVSSSTLRREDSAAVWTMWSGQPPTCVWPVTNGERTAQ